MRALECLLINFAVVRGSNGRLLTEGFENKHCLMCHLKAMLLSALSASQQVQRLSQQQQIHLIASMAAVFEQLQQAKKARKARSTGPHGLLQNRGQTRNDEQLHETPEGNNSAEEKFPEDCFRATDGCLLPPSLRKAKFWKPGTNCSKPAICLAHQRSQERPSLHE